SSPYCSHSVSSTYRPSPTPNPASTAPAGTSRLSSFLMPRTVTTVPAPGSHSGNASGTGSRASSSTVRNRDARHIANEVGARNMKIEGRNAVVTGAGSGIGRALAIALADAGAAVVVADVEQSKAQATADEIAAKGGRAHAAVCDVRDSKDVARLAD